MTSSFHYVGGEEVNTSPTQRTHTIVTSINFRDLPAPPSADLRAPWADAGEGSAPAVGFAPGSCLSTTRNPVAADWPELIAYRGRARKTGSGYDARPYRPSQGAVVAVRIVRDAELHAGLICSL